MYRPQAIIVENVDEHEARSAIESALLGIEGYTWKTFAEKEPAAGDMRRRRRYWIGKRA